MGASHSDYILNALMAGSRQALFDEVWAINAMGGVIDCDRIFMMDGPSYLMNDTKGMNDDCSGYAGFIRNTRFRFTPPSQSLTWLRPLWPIRWSSF